MTLVPADPDLERARHEALAPLGRRIRELRLGRSMTQQQLADATGLHRVTINKLEHGQLDVGVSNVKALDASPGDLFSPLTQRRRQR